MRVESWWDRLRVRQKDVVIVLLLCAPLIFAIPFHVILINKLRVVQQHHRDLLLAHDQIHSVRRLAIDIEDAFRGYLLTRQDAFLKPLEEAESKIHEVLSRTFSLTDVASPDLSFEVHNVGNRLLTLIASKRALLEDFRAGKTSAVLSYVQSGQGLRLSDAVRRDLRMIEDRLDVVLATMDENEEQLSRLAFWGMILVACFAVAVVFVGMRLLIRSISAPLELLRTSVARMNQQASTDGPPIVIPVRSTDEIGQLARSCEEMLASIRQHIQGLETINEIGNEINSITPGGLDGMLCRIADHAVKTLDADICFVLRQQAQLRCWIVEAASGVWHDRFHKTVMLWDEFPMSVQAVQTGQPTMGQCVGRYARCDVGSADLPMKESRLAIPLISAGETFGVLVLVDQKDPKKIWNCRLAQAFAEAVAIAIGNARLLEAAQQKGKGLESRLRHLEYLAEMLAHDLKGPGERMRYLAARLAKEYGDGQRPLDEQALSWVHWIDGYGQQLSERLENILDVARVGTTPEELEAIDPALVLRDVLKAHASELEAHNVRIITDLAITSVPCHREYLRQVFDNLISNAIKFACLGPAPAIRITAARTTESVMFTVSDNGPGIAPEERERVFQPFVRLDLDAKGSGIGLTIVKRIVELYGGQVWVAGDPLGCTLNFTLPALGDFGEHSGESVKESRARTDCPPGLAAR